MMVALVFVVTAALGAVVRVATGDHLDSDEWPSGTFAVNVAASFAAGALSGVGPPWTTVAGIGGVAAASSWALAANGAAALARAGQGSRALLYLAATVSSGILAAWLGLQLS